MTVPLAIPPEETISKAKLGGAVLESPSSDVLTVKPPELTVTSPPLVTTALLTVPPLLTSIRPPTTIALMLKPPERTVSLLPLVTVSPLTGKPEEMTVLLVGIAIS